MIHYVHQRNACTYLYMLICCVREKEKREHRVSTLARWQKGMTRLAGFDALAKVGCVLGIRAQGFEQCGRNSLALHHSRCRE